MTENCKNCLNQMPWMSGKGISLFTFPFASHGAASRAFSQGALLLPKIDLQVTGSV